MHINIIHSKLLLFLLLPLIFPETLFAKDFKPLITDTSAHIKPDTSKIRSRRVTNREFNDVYQQNLMVSFAGQEYYDPHKTLLVADLAPNFILFGTPKLPFFFVATARVNLRLFDTHGDPVKSPSYMPGGTLYFRLNSNYYSPRFLSLGFSHESNGTEGPTLNPNGTINADSGKFSTNYFILTYHTGKRTDSNNLIINRYDAIGLQLDGPYAGLGYIPDLRGKYGFLRINGDWLYNIARANTDPVDPNRKVFGNWQRMDFQFTYVADKVYNYDFIDVKKRLNVSFKYYYQFPFMQNVSLLGGVGYRGQDEYNIFFQDSYAYITIGLAAGLSFNMHPKQ